MGIDVRNNEEAKPIVARRRGKWLTEQEERDLRNSHIDYSLGVLKRRTPFFVKANMSPEKEAMAVGAIYRGDADALLKYDTPLRRAFYDNEESKFDAALQKHYKKNKVAPRNDSHNKFWSQRRGL